MTNSKIVYTYIVDKEKLTYDSHLQTTVLKTQQPVQIRSRGLHLTD